MAAHAGEPAWKSGTFVCQQCHAKVRVQKGRAIPKCPNGHATFDERVAEPRKQKPLAGHPRRRSAARPARRTAKKTAKTGARRAPSKTRVSAKTSRKKAPSRSRRSSSSSTSKRKSSSRSRKKS